MKKSQFEREYFRAKDIAARYGIAVSTVRLWARKGRLPDPIKMTRRCSLWKIEDVEKVFQNA